MKKIYEQYTRYNLWANQRLVDSFSTLTDEQLNAPVVSSFPSIRLTFLHIWDAEFCWLSRLNGVSPDAFPSKTFQGDMKAVFETVLGTSKQFADFVAAQPEDFLEKTVEFKTLSYGGGKQAAFEMMHHCMNHSSFHRGQLITLGRQLGLEKFPPTDFIYYLKETGQ
ncbi:MAG: DinB family protein [Saprospiraceae bacterium]|nr:DinB family protein [Saprospiraceae bacterium]